MRKIIAILICDFISTAQDIFLFVSSFSSPTNLTCFSNHQSLHYHNLCLSQRTAGCFGPNLGIFGKLKTLPDQYISLFYESLPGFSTNTLRTRINCLQKTSFVGISLLSIFRVVLTVLPVTFW